MSRAVPQLHCRTALNTRHASGFARVLTAGRLYELRKAIARSSA
jgi:hypothetical protein